MFDDLPPAPKKPPELSLRLKELARELADALRRAWKPSGQAGAPVAPGPEAERQGMAWTRPTRFTTGRRDASRRG